MRRIMEGEMRTKARGNGRRATNPHPDPRMTHPVVRQGLAVIIDTEPV